MFDLATNLLDPSLIIMEKLFLAMDSHLLLYQENKKRIAPKLDQHACHEKNEMEISFVQVR